MRQLINGIEANVEVINELLVKVSEALETGSADFSHAGALKWKKKRNNKKNLLHLKCMDDTKKVSDRKNEISRD